MAFVLSSLSGNLISAASAGFAPTNSADVSAIASSYQVVSATATQLNAGTAYLTSVNETPISAARAGNAANASLANSAWYDGTGRMISSLPDEATVSSIASAYVESAASSKQDTLSFGYDDDKISAINGSALAGQGGGGLVTAIGTSTSGITSINNSGLVDTAALRSADYSSLYVQEPLYISASGGSSYIGISGDIGGIDSATCSAIASAYAESAASSKLDTTAFNSGDFYSTSNPSGFITGVDLSTYATTAYVDSSVSGKADSSAMTSYALSADVSGTVDLVSTQSANWGGSALALSAGPGVKLEKVGDTLVAGLDETVLFSGSNSGMVATPLTEPLSGFDSFKICFNPFTGNGMSREWKEFSWADSSDVYTVATFYRAQNDNLAWYVAFQPNSDGTTITPITNKLNTLGTSAVQDRTQIHVYKVVGINRTAEV